MWIGEGIFSGYHLLPLKKNANGFNFVNSSSSQFLKMREQYWEIEKCEMLFTVLRCQQFICNQKNHDHGICILNQEKHVPSNVNKDNIV